MVAYTHEPKRVLRCNGVDVPSFTTSDDSNLDAETVASFGDEWNKFDNFSPEDVERAGSEYFDVISNKDLEGAVVLDAGCGSGRWSGYVSTRVKWVEAIDPSEAILSAAVNHRHRANVRFTQASISHLPFPEASFDLVVCLGVLHHVPDTKQALSRLRLHLKPGRKLLLYLYYNLENRSAVYRSLFLLSELARKFISARSAFWKKTYSDLLAVILYMPLVILVRLCAYFAPFFAARLPLAYYMNKSFYIIRNDTLDRFGTPLQRRFSKDETTAMLEASGFTDIVFSANTPYWHCVARKNRNAPPRHRDDRRY